MGQTISCKNGHTWNGLTPTIDPNILQEQNSSLVGTNCDCGKFIYNSKNCVCGIPQREIWLQYNPDYKDF